MLDRAKTIDQQIAELANYPTEDVLFFLACSNRKVETEQPIPLRDLYDGPTWQTLRTHGGHILDSAIIVLSGKYGWTPAGQYTSPYNERISKQKVDALIARGASEQERTSKGHVIGWTPVQLVARAWGKAAWKAVVVCGGEEYRRAFDAIIPELKALGYIEAEAPVITTVGGIGEQRGQLGEILRQLAPRPSTEEEAESPSLRF